MELDKSGDFCLVRTCCMAFVFCYKVYWATKASLRLLRKTLYNHCSIGPRAECVGCLFQVQRTVGELIVGVDEFDDQLLRCYGLDSRRNGSYYQYYYRYKF